jgi:zinc finger protein
MLNPNETLEALSTAIKPADINEVLQFPATCPMCKAPGLQKMLDVKIPFFKEAIVMAFVCDECGFKNSEIKSGGAIAAKGRRLTLRVTEQEDLARDILKSDTCLMRIPEIELKLTAGTLGGKFTTVEGLLMNVVEQFKGYPFMAGDSSSVEERRRMEEFVNRLEGMSKGVEPFTLILDDPVSNSYVQSLTAPEKDPKLDEVEYERTWKQNEELGLNDINTAEFETVDHEHEEKKEEKH